MFGRTQLQGRELGLGLEPWAPASTAAQAAALTALCPPPLPPSCPRRTDLIPPALLQDYQKLLSSAPARRLNPSKVAESKFLNNTLVGLVAFMENIAGGCPAAGAGAASAAQGVPEPELPQRAAAPAPAPAALSCLCRSFGAVQARPGVCLLPLLPACAAQRGAVQDPCIAAAQPSPAPALLPASLPTPRGAWDSRARSPPTCSPHPHLPPPLPCPAVKDSIEKESFFKRLPATLPTLPANVMVRKILPLLASALEFGESGFAAASQAWQLPCLTLPSPCTLALPRPCAPPPPPCAAAW
jgi:hypothetical protein